MKDGNISDEQRRAAELEAAGLRRDSFVGAGSTDYDGAGTHGGGVQPLGVQRIRQQAEANARAQETESAERMMRARTREYENQWAHGESWLRYVEAGGQDRGEFERQWSAHLAKRAIESLDN